MPVARCIDLMDKKLRMICLLFPRKVAAAWFPTLAADPDRSMSIRLSPITIWSKGAVFAQFPAQQAKEV